MALRVTMLCSRSEDCRSFFSALRRSRAAIGSFDGGVPDVVLSCPSRSSRPLRALTHYTPECFVSSPHGDREAVSCGCVLDGELIFIPMRFRVGGSRI